MTGPRILIEVDTSGVERAIDRVEQRAERSGRKINGALGRGGVAYGSLGIGSSYEFTGGSSSGGGVAPASRWRLHSGQGGQAIHYRPSPSQTLNQQNQDRNVRRLSDVIAALNNRLGRQVSPGKAKELAGRFDELVRSGAYGSSRLKRYSGLDDWLSRYQDDFLHGRDANRHFREVARRIGLDVPGEDGKRRPGILGGTSRMAGRVARMFGGGGGVVGGAIDEAAAASAGGASGLMSAGVFGKALGFGAALYAGNKVMGAVSDAGNEMVGYSDLRAKLGPLTTEFDHLRDSVRFASRGLGMTYEEAQKLAGAFVHTANVQADGAKFIGEEVRNAAGFGRGFGMDPSQANDFFAQMRHFGVTNNTDESRRLAVMIGESVGKGGNFAKSDEVLAAISSYTSIVARQSLAAPNVEGYASMLSSMTGLHLPGMDPAGAAGMLGKLNSAIAGGGAAGEASQNFSLGMYQRAMKGFDALDLGVMGSGGAFGKVSDLFGEDSVAYRAADEATRARYRGYVESAGGRRVIDMQMQGLMAQYGGDSRMLREAGAAHFGLSAPEFDAMRLAYERDGGLSSMMDRLETMKVPTSKLNAKSIAALAQLETGDNAMLNGQAEKLKALTGPDSLNGDELRELKQAQEDGGERLRDVVMKLTAQHDTVKDEGQRTRETIADMKSVLTDFASKLVPLTNTIKEAIVAVARKLAPDSAFSIQMAAQESNSKRDIESTRRQVKEYDQKIRFFENEGNNKEKAEEYRGYKRQLLKAQRDVAHGSSAHLYTDDAREAFRKMAEEGGVEAPPPSQADGGNRAGGAKTKKELFVERWRGQASRVAAALNVPVDAVLGQWALESDYGQRPVGNFNLGNIKAGKAWRGDTRTGYDKAEGSNDAYRSYGSADQFADDYIGLIKRKYPGAVGAKSAGAFAGALKDGGYATDPGYVDSVTRTARGFSSVATEVRESGKVPGAGVAGANNTQPQKVSLESRIILTDRDGNELHDPIIQTHIGGPVPAGA